MQSEMRLGDGDGAPATLVVTPAVVPNGAGPDQYAGGNLYGVSNSITRASGGL